MVFFKAQCLPTLLDETARGARPAQDVKQVQDLLGL